MSQTSAKMNRQNENEPPGTIARKLVRSARTAVLSTSYHNAAPEPDLAGGWPYGSLVLTACSQEGVPILLLSQLAEHTKNIHTDDRVSLLYDATASRAHPLTGERATVLGRVMPAETGDRERYLSRYPDAQVYAEFQDFAFYRVAPERCHLVAGFGRIEWIAEQDLLLDTASCRQIAAAETEIVAHMNADHADALSTYAGRFGRKPGAWRMSGCDTEGCDIELGGEYLRLPFGTHTETPDDVRRELIRLARPVSPDPDTPASDGF